MPTLLIEWVSTFCVARTSRLILFQRSKQVNYPVSYAKMLFRVNAIAICMISPFF